MSEADEAQIKQWMEQYRDVRRKLAPVEKLYRYYSKMEQILRELLELHEVKPGPFGIVPDKVEPVGKTGENLLDLASAPSAPTNGDTHESKKPTGLRDIIREALQPAGSSRKPKDIIAFVKKSGVKFEGRSSLATRVANQIFRMKENGFLIRNEEGEYALNPNRQ